MTKIEPGQIGRHPFLHPLGRQRDKLPGGRRPRQACALWSRHVAFGQPHRTSELARRDVDQHLVHRPFAEPVFALRGLPARRGSSLPSSREVGAAPSRPCRRENRSCLSSCPPLRLSPPPPLCARRRPPAPPPPSSRRAPRQAARQNRSKLADLLASASVFIAFATIAVDAVVSCMALLPFVNSTPRA